MEEVVAVAEAGQEDGNGDRNDTRESEYERSPGRA